MYGKRINISGDEISGETAAAILTKVTGKEIRYEVFSPDFIRQQSEDLAIMYEWFNADGYTADLEAMNSFGFSNFEQWASMQDWSALG